MLTLSGLFLAALAETGELQSVRIDAKLQLLSQSQDFSFDICGVYGQNPAAGTAQQMVVVALIA
jgi:hypothetical protein